MEIKYTGHLQWRLQIRSIPYQLPQQIWEHAQEHYKDSLSGHFIAVHKVKFGGKSRELAVSYDKKRNIIELITIHPIKARQKNSRILSGRWVRQ